MIIHADNLLALKALLPKFEGKIKCIYIDPPYNTGNEGWIYNDNVSDPRLQKWIGEVVGREGEDLTRHDKWLCMMYPRLQLLQKLLRDDGAIFISIDDNELYSLKFVCDEIFGASNFVADIVWEKMYTTKNDSSAISNSHEYIIIYAKNVDSLNLNLLPRTAEMDARYKNPDNDPRGVWKSNPLQAKSGTNTDSYTFPNGVTWTPPPGTFRRYSEDTLKKFYDDNRIYFGADGKSVPRAKKFLYEVQQGSKSKSLWKYDEVGHNHEARTEIKTIFDGKNIFDTPKPTRLIEKILQLATDKDSIILDSFAGSGTTAHAVINLNKADSGSRRFILIEMMNYAEDITAERVRRIGGEFNFYELGEKLFEGEDINPAVPIEKLREYIYWTETRKNLPPSTDKYLLGVESGTAYYYFGEEIALDFETLNNIKAQASHYVVYAGACILDEEQLAERRITFKQIPYDVQKY